MYFLYPIICALRDLEWDLMGSIDEPMLRELLTHWKPVDELLRRFDLIKSQDYRELRNFAKDHQINYEYPYFDPHNRIGIVVHWRQRFFWAGRAKRISHRLFTIMDQYRIIQNNHYLLCCMATIDPQIAVCILRVKHVPFGFQNHLQTLQDAKSSLLESHTVITVPSVTLPVIADLCL